MLTYVIFQNAKYFVISPDKNVNRGFESLEDARKYRSTMAECHRVKALIVKRMD